jgi:hypothetical protein
MTVATPLSSTTVIPTTSFAEDMRQQVAILQHMADCITERGFCISVNAENRYSDRPQFLFSFMTGGFREMTREWGHRRGHTPLIIHVAHGKSSVPPDEYAEALTDPLYFSCVIEPLAKLRPIMVAIEIVAEKTTMHGPIGKTLQYYEDSDKISIRGNSRLQLETLVNILNMPQHRKILLHPVRKPKKVKTNG